jgi:hypothetical protein
VKPWRLAKRFDLAATEKESRVGSTETRANDRNATDRYREAVRLQECDCVVGGHGVWLAQKDAPYLDGSDNVVPMWTLSWLSLSSPTQHRSHTLAPGHYNIQVAVAFGRKRGSSAAVATTARYSNRATIETSTARLERISFFSSLKLCNMAETGPCLQRDM